MRSREPLILPLPEASKTALPHNQPDGADAAALVRLSGILFPLRQAGALLQVCLWTLARLVGRSVASHGAMTFVK